MKKIVFVMPDDESYRQVALQCALVIKGIETLQTIQKTDFEMSFGVNEGKRLVIVLFSGEQTLVEAMESDVLSWFPQWIQKEE